MEKAKLEASRFVIEFTLNEKLSLKALCSECDYTVPNTERPYAEKTMANGSHIRVTRDERRNVVIITWDGPVTDWAEMRFCIDIIYHDLAAIGFVEKPTIT